MAQADGNLGVVDTNAVTPANALWEMFESVVIGDANGRVLVYFPDEMERYGVSRYRLEAEGEVPHSSKIMGLVPITDNSLHIPSVPGEGEALPNALLVTVDTIGEQYFTLLCTYKDHAIPSKIYITDHIDAGIATLQGPETDDTLTGGPVEKCTYWPMINGQPSVA